MAEYKLPYTAREIQNKLSKVDTILPASSTDDSGKVLTVGTDGTTIWSAPASGLPSATTDDNGKFLRVVDGVWTMVNITNVSDEGA